MKRKQQKKILELIQTLDEANAEIDQLILLKQDSTIIQLLADCQEFVVQIGTFIEDIEGEGTRTVTLLEGYHELLYEASLAVNSETEKGNLLRRLRKQLSEIEYSIRDELKPNKIEVAFFPYKASMFDCMESVWLAAKSDPQCDVYVVPIPYYDRLPGGVFGQMHYEGEQYPDDVPIVDWRTYNIEDRHPDVIFVHNPYDDGNVVTSVHPDFYCKRLKHFTDMLVYIPYFVVQGHIPEHFCVLAGTVYADRVIVQSEEVRQTYIRAFKEFETRNNCKNRFGRPEDKFVALGSPKFDKVFQTKREDADIPEVWQLLIEKSDEI